MNFSIVKFNIKNNMVST